jgi:transposase-like protein
VAKSTRRQRRAQPNVVLYPASFQRAWRMRPAPDLSRIARARLRMLDWHREHGESVARTARHFGYSRPTVYRWLARFERSRLETLEDRSSRPARRRRPTWTLAQLTAVRHQRERYPRWGKDKLAVLLRRDGIGLSVSMVGRILGRLRATGELWTPARRRMGVHRRRWARPYAIRRPAGWAVERPGDLVELDTLDIRPLPARITEAVHRPRRRLPLGCARAGTPGDSRDRGRGPRSPRRADAVSGPGDQHRQRF